jgi:hypothetical protein
MGIPPMNIKIPSASRLFIFGSALSSSLPRDLDVLCVYDPLYCHPGDAYAMHRDLVEELETAFGLNVDLTLLTHTEEQDLDFIRRFGAVDFRSAKAALGKFESIAFQTN